MNKAVFFLTLVVFLQACAQKSDYGDLEYLAKLPSELDEISGIVSLDGSNVWAMVDSGNEDDIYNINLKGEIIKKLDVKNVENNDWEDIAKDEKGNLYIGDFGNNANKRKNLSILKLPNPKNEKGDKINAEKIKFKYPDQKEYPPKKSRFLFDCEAFFHSNGFLYIITKNRARPYTGKALIYKVPAARGSYTAELVGSFTACSDSESCSITAADISPDGKKIALLGYGKIWIFTDFISEDFTSGTMQAIDLKYRTQQESICFLNNSTLLIADEKYKNTGRNLYSYEID